MKLSSFFLFVATGLILCTSLSAQQYHDAAAFGLKGNVKECKAISARDGSDEDPHGFFSLSFSKDGELESIKKNPSDRGRISDIVRSNGLLMGFKYVIKDSSSGQLFDIRFRYKGSKLTGFYTLITHGLIDAHGDFDLSYFDQGYQVHYFPEAGKDSFKEEFLAVTGIIFKDRFTALIEEGFKQGGNFIPKLKSVAEELWKWDLDDILLGGYGPNSITTDYIIDTRDSHGNYTLLTDDDGKFIKRFITYWDDEPATAKTTKATPKPAAAPAPKPAITEKTHGLRPATPKELSVEDLITRPFGVLSRNSSKLSMEQILYDLSDYGWNYKINDVTNSIDLTATSGYDMTFQGMVPESVSADFVSNKLCFLSYTFHPSNRKEATKFQKKVIALLKAEGVELPSKPSFGRTRWSSIYNKSLIGIGEPSGPDPLVTIILCVSYVQDGKWIE